MRWTAREGDLFDAGKMVTWVMDKRDLLGLIRYLDQAVEVVIDLENTGLDEHAVTNGRSNGGVAARIALASITLPTENDLRNELEPTTFILPLSHPDSPWVGQWRKVMRKLAWEIVRRNLPITNHNMKYDARWIFALTGINLAPFFEWDTQLSSHLLDENESTKLKERAPDTFAVERWDDFDLSTPGAAERVPMFELALYGARDTYWTWRLAEYHRDLMNLNPFTSDDPMDEEEVELARLGQLMRYVVMPTSITLTEMEQRGVVLDAEETASRLIESREIAGNRGKQLATLYADPGPEGMSFAPTSNWFKAWSEKAVEMGDLRVVSLTPSGNPQWSKSVLKKLDRKGYPAATALLDLRDHTKRAEFLTSWTDKLSVKGTIHTTYRQGSVLTGRLSSAGPNMQQVSKILRPCFMPSPGMVIADIDYSQLELRVAAHFSQSIPMLEAYQRGDDLHRLFAASINEIPEEEVTKEQRQQAKAGNFGLLYLQSPGGFRIYAEDVYEVFLTDEEALKIHGKFFETWIGIREWHQKTLRRAHSTGQVVSPLGRVRRLPNIFSGNEKLVGEAERQAVNSTVQGFGSDLMLSAASSIEGALPGVPAVDEARLIGTVHDSILVEVPEDSWEEVTRECIARMVHVPEYLAARTGLEFTVPLEAEAVVGSRWSLDDVGVIE